MAAGSTIQNQRMDESRAPGTRLSTHPNLNLQTDSDALPVNVSQRLMNIQPAKFSQISKNLEDQ